MNWYKTAQVEKKPYKIYKVGSGKEEEAKELGYIWAYSSEQARMIALKNNPKLREYLAFCSRSHTDCEVVAKIDNLKWQEVQKYQANLKEKKEEQVQEAWWNK